MGRNLHLQLPSKYTVGTFGCVWASQRAKPRLLTQKPSQKGCLRNRETAWPGELKDTVFRPALGDLQCQTSHPESIKKGDFAALECNLHLQLPSKYTVGTFGCVGVQFAPPIAFEIHRWHLRLRLDITTGKTTTSDPKAFPKRLPPEQGNSMVWRAQ